MPVVLYYPCSNKEYLGSFLPKCFSRQLIPQSICICVLSSNKAFKTLILVTNADDKWAAWSKKVPWSKRKMCRFTSSCACLKYHLGFCSSFYCTQWFCKQTAKAQIRLHRHTVWSGPLLSVHAPKAHFRLALVHMREICLMNLGILRSNCAFNQHCWGHMVQTALKR